MTGLTPSQDAQQKPAVKTSISEIRKMNLKGISEKKDPQIYIDHIFETADEIDELIGEMGFEEFLKDIAVKKAVVCNLMIIGEAAGCIDQETRAKYHDVKWSKIVGMRNKLIHEYFGIDYEAVWGAVRTHLPELKQQLKKTRR